MLSAKEEEDGGVGEEMHPFLSPSVLDYEAVGLPFLIMTVPFNDLTCKQWTPS